MLSGIAGLQAQQDTLSSPTDSLKLLQMDRPVVSKNATTDINAPAKAAFYSAVLPGLGQAYNKQYWKIPLVYALIGGGIYLYQFNQNQYLRYRKAYQNRLLGYPDEFPQYSTDILITAQSYYRRNRDLALMGTVLMYVLNIVDANVSAHLRLWNINDNLSWHINPPCAAQPAWGISFNYRF
jgi:hypothetical protein